VGAGRGLVVFGERVVMVGWGWRLFGALRAFWDCGCGLWRAFRGWSLRRVRRLRI